MFSWFIRNFIFPYILFKDCTGNLDLLYYKDDDFYRDSDRSCLPRPLQLCREHVLSVQISIEVISGRPVPVREALCRYNCRLLIFLYGFLSTNYAHDEPLHVLDRRDFLHPFSLHDSGFLEQFMNNNFDVSGPYGGDFFAKKNSMKVYIVDPGGTAHFRNEISARPATPSKT